MAGAFDALERNRALVHGNADQIMDVASRLRADGEIGQGSLFGGAPATGRFGREHRTACSSSDLSRPWAPMERLQHEFAGVGFYLSGHPLDAYASVLPKLGVQSYTDFEARAGHGVDRGETCRCRHFLARAQIPERQQVRFRDPFGRVRPVRGGHLLRHARALARSARAWNAAPTHGRGGARRRKPEDARAVYRGAGGRGCQRAARAQAGARSGARTSAWSADSTS